ncbi:hypothetical protein BAUCODRAFT_486094 [Baudoinia panamericana UAMH 10762]|uniref:Uncharacterized protein n=1 Tax=Baudoinia panamericana (strain UAMH 10762) TaxID=717646 RepID=M2MJ38_BAUPA|nr:uncharacterized protein BAUCODRAFT_486094 [Baudoinia panamericana UAMH 10762]EMC96686.1 hypothetical protein BAUCODRAFT_486094 [Baudoinia panamericana UAMH 10762]
MMIASVPACRQNDLQSPRCRSIRLQLIVRATQLSRRVLQRFSSLRFRLPDSHEVGSAEAKVT